MVLTYIANVYIVYAVNYSKSKKKQHMTIFRHETLTIYNYVLHFVYADQQLHLGIATDATRTHYTAQKNYMKITIEQ